MFKYNLLQIGQNLVELFLDVHIIYISNVCLTTSPRGSSFWAVDATFIATDRFVSPQKQAYTHCNKRNAPEHIGVTL